MSPRLQVLRLQDYCVRYALSAIHDKLQTCKEDLHDLHNVFIATLHSGIRQQLINQAFIEYRRDTCLMIDIVCLLMDSSTRSLVPKPESSYFNSTQCHKLFSLMNRLDATGLNELKVAVHSRNKVVIHPSFKVTAEWSALASLNSLLTRGLAANLHTLMLRNACDNEVLGVLGRAALNLKNLDISDNWLIDEEGISQLLFKDSNCVRFPKDLDSCESWILKEMSAIPDENLTRCCQTLQEVRIQDTNTSGISVLMLLMFIKNLQSLGGFLYYRNLGDCILAVKPYRSRLALTKLWDMHLPWEKIQSIGEVIAHRLQTLYTRVSQVAHVHTKQLPFTNLQDLTIDFDFAYEPRFAEFLAANGGRLSRLVLIDQGYGIDITILANCCPLLVELAANVCLENHFPSSQFAHLKDARLKVSSADAFKWIMVNCPIIRRLEARMGQDWDMQGNFGALNNKVIVELADMGLPSLDTIEHLSISFMNDTVDRLDSSAIWTLVRACAQLTRIEDVHTWQQLSNSCAAAAADTEPSQQQQYLNVAADLVEQNYDIDVRYKHISLTDFYRGQSTHHSGVLLAHAHLR